MFVRRKQNKSGTISIQVVAKVSGKYRVQKSFGSSRDEATLISLERKAANGLTNRSSERSCSSKMMLRHMMPFLPV
jgi:hypothetical protein